MHRTESFTSLFEGIAGTEISAGEKITSCGVRNLDTGEVIECEWHADGWGEAWERGWYDRIREEFPDAGSIRELTDEKGGYRAMGTVTEDGFNTTRGRFLGREEALVMARKAKQLNNVRASYDADDSYLRAEEVEFA